MYCSDNILIIRSKGFATGTLVDLHNNIREYWYLVKRKIKVCGIHEAKRMKLFVTWKFLRTSFSD